ncbi:MAG: DUF2007 domain-containing protein [Ardenticatenales bacterium]|nr:DUF2007 domain-containing protein [Ardenticatenales bacterium]
MTVLGAAVTVLGDAAHRAPGHAPGRVLKGVARWLKGFAGALARFGGGDGPGETVTVYVARTIEEAWVVRGRLAAHDVPSVLVDNMLSSVYGSALQGGVDVRVPAALAERAEAILNGQAD